MSRLFYLDYTYNITDIFVDIDKRDGIINLVVQSVKLLKCT